MSTDPAEKLLQQWANKDLTVERGMGQSLQHLVALIKRLDELEKRIRQLEQASKNQPERNTVGHK